MSEHDEMWAEAREALELLAKTGRRSSVLARAMRADPVRYAGLNAEVMKPIHEARARAKAAEIAKAKAEEEKRARRAEEADRATVARVEAMVDRRVAALGVPSK